MNIPEGIPLYPKDSLDVWMQQTQGEIFKSHLDPIDFVMMRPWKVGLVGLPRIRRQTCCLDKVANVAFLTW